MMNGIGWGMDGGGWIWMILGVILVVALIWFFGTVLPGRDWSPTEDAAATLRFKAVGTMHASMAPSGTYDPNGR